MDAAFAWLIVHGNHHQAGMLGQTSVWQEISANSSGDFVLTAGQEYAVLASVSQNYSVAQITSYLTGHGYQVLYAWEYGTAGRSPAGSMDTWLASLPADTTSNHRWVYGEVVPTAATTIGQNAPWPLTIYSIAHAFQAVAAAAQPTSVLPTPEAGGVTPSQAAAAASQQASTQPALLQAPTTTTLPSRSFSWATFAGGLLLGGVVTVGALWLGARRVVALWPT